MLLKRFLFPIIILILCSYAADWTSDPDCKWAITFDQKTGDMLDLCGTFNGDMDGTYPPPPLRTEGQFYNGANFVSGNQLPFGDVTFMDGLSAWSLGFWLAQSEHYATLEREIFRKDGTMNIQDSAGIERVYLWTSDNPTGFNFTVSADNLYPTGTFWISEDGNYHHYLVTYNGTTIKAYRDCILINSTALTGTMKNSPNQLTLGRKDIVEGGLDYVYTGKMDDFIFLDREIDVTECNDLKENGIDGTSGHYPKMFNGRSVTIKGVTINGG